MNLNLAFNGEERAFKNNSGNNWKIWIWTLHSPAIPLGEIFPRDIGHINKSRYVQHL